MWVGWEEGSKWRVRGREKWEWKNRKWVEGEQEMVGVKEGKKWWWRIRSGIGRSAGSDSEGRN